MKLAIDFDDVINGPDGPMPGALAALVTLLNRGHEIIVLTAQTDLDSDVGVRHWLRVNWPQNQGPAPEATNVKCAADAYIDDKAVRFTDWADILRQFP